MAQDSQVVVFPGQRGGTGAATLLFQGKVTRPLPQQLGPVGVVQGAVVSPRSRAHHLETIALTARHVTGGEGAAIGDQQASASRQQFAEQVQLLGNGGVTVVVAVGGVPQDRQSAEFIDDHAEANVNQLGVGNIVAEGDVCGRI